MGKKNNYVDGYTALRAAQRAAQDKRDARAGPPSAAPPPADSRGKGPAPPGEAPIAAHAHRTVMPTKYEVVCYECGFTFKQSGRAKHTTCPKCRAILDFVDRVIEGEWSGTMKTAGQVTIAPDAVIKGGELFAADLVVKGRIEGGKAEAYRWLEIHAGATVCLECVSMRDLRLRPGAPLRLPGRTTLRDVTLEDVLTADLEVTGLLHIKAGGCLDGAVQGTRLRVDDGGGLRADVRIENTSAEKK